MIVMKFGGTSVADAERILAVGEIIRSRLDRRPVVVLSALAGVTDLLVSAVAAARDGNRDELEKALGELEKRHRWAIAGTLGRSARRHDVSLEIDAVFDELRQLLRSVRILGEGTPRAADTLLAFGETLSTRIAAAAFREQGLRARWIDPRDVMTTDGHHGAAEPDLEAVSGRAGRRIEPILDAGEIPLMGGFVGATPEGHTTTLGRGGSDTSAAVLGAALGAEEIQIWTDVDGLMTADPRWVPGARPLERVSFPEAAELAYYGARVLHPASIAPAVHRQIPVRVLNSMNPGHPGTVIVGETSPDAPALASVASRGGVCACRITGRRMGSSPEFLPDVLGRFGSAGVVPDLVASSEVGVTLVISDDRAVPGIAEVIGPDAALETMPNRAIVCVVGAGLARDDRVRGEVLSALAEIRPEVVSLGGSGISVSAVVPEDGLKDAVQRLHGRFFE